MAGCFFRHARNGPGGLGTATVQRRATAEGKPGLVIAKREFALVEEVNQEFAILK